MRKDIVLVSAFWFLVLGIGFVSAAGPVEFLSEFAGNFIGIWEEGVDTYASVILWVILVLIVLLIYSSLSFVDFPERSFLKWAIAIIVGLLASSFISQEEIITLAKSYAALGVMAIIFIPILILAFFTFIVSVRGSSLGQAAQKFLWIAYSVFLFVKAGGLILAQLAEKYESIGNNGFIIYFLEIIGVKANEANIAILITLIVVAIAVFFIFVRKNKVLTDWFEEQKEKAERQKSKDTAARAKAVEEARANETQ